MADYVLVYGNMSTDVGYTHEWATASGTLGGRVWEIITLTLKAQTNTNANWLRLDATRVVN